MSGQLVASTPVACRPARGRCVHSVPLTGTARAARCLHQLQVEVARDENWSRDLRSDTNCNERGASLTRSTEPTVLKVALLWLAPLPHILTLIQGYSILTLLYVTYIIYLYTQLYIYRIYPICIMHINIYTISYIYTIYIHLRHMHMGYSIHILYRTVAGLTPNVTGVHYHVRLLLWEALQWTSCRPYDCVKGDSLPLRQRVRDSRLPKEWAIGRSK